MDSVDFCAKATYYIFRHTPLFIRRFCKRFMRINTCLVLCSLTLLSCHTNERLLRKNPSTCIGGYVAPGFEEVKDVFAENFSKRGEKGAALSVYVNDTLVVNLYGGYKDKKFRQIWDENTLVLLFSATKGITAMTTAIGISQGLFNLNDKIGSYWKAFSKNGKENITINQMLSHQSGIPMFHKNIRIKHINDTLYIRDVLENQRTYWEPGTRQAYQLYSGGLYLNGLFKHADPRQRSLDRFFYDEIARPLGIEFYFGLPDTINHDRLAYIIPITSLKSFFKFWQLPGAVRRKVYNPFSMLNKTFRILIGFNPNDRKFLSTSLPSINGVGKVTDIARLYGIFSGGAHVLGLKEDVFNEIVSPGIIMPDNNKDLLLGIPMFYRFGFRKPSPGFSFGTSDKAFGMTGAGGSFAFADPDLKLGYCYGTRKMKGFAHNDPREKALRECVYKCIENIKKNH